jgi:hypothetical protein
MSESGDSMEQPQQSEMTRLYDDISTGEVKSAHEVQRYFTLAAKAFSSMAEQQSAQDKDGLAVELRALASKYEYSGSGNIHAGSELAEKISLKLKHNARDIESTQPTRASEYSEMSSNWHKASIMVEGLRKTLGR